jgi:curved DNA-binding protein
MFEVVDEPGDYYRLLGVPRDASLERIKRAYKRLAREYHPDTVGGSVERFRALQHAYETLSNPEKRARYDRALEMDRRPASSAIPVAVSYHDTVWADRAEISSGEILLSPAEAAAGGILPLEFPVQSRCPECRGSGGTFWICAACDGFGARTARQPVALRIPPGVQDGTIFQVRLDDGARTTIVLAVHILRR